MQQRPTQGDALGLPTGDLPRLVRGALSHPNVFQQLHHPRRAAFLGLAPVQAGLPHVIQHGAGGIQCRVLEHETVRRGTQRSADVPRALGPVRMVSSPGWKSKDRESKISPEPGNEKLRSRVDTPAASTVIASGRSVPSPAPTAATSHQHQGQNHTTSQNGASTGRSSKHKDRFLNHNVRLWVTTQTLPVRLVMHTKHETVAHQSGTAQDAPMSRRGSVHFSGRAWRHGRRAGPTHPRA